MLRRTKTADPVSGLINRTEIVISRMGEDGREIRKQYRCAGPVSIENQYEKNRPGRPPRPRFDPTNSRLGST
ncbi:hypothetical protein [Kitasatospora sp. NPDC101183]|uniref:hypothetical protein n=1 Tax=Kitasatospora sp. NPDC101183 TaxID=3364100 RepID=UPI00381450E6